jgi:C-terminal peptidase prc
VPSATPAITNTPAPTPIPPDPTATLAPIAAADREQIFNQVWATVRDRYVYTDFRGLDWEAIRAEYAPQVLAAPDSAAFYDVIKAMIGRLGDDHSRFDSPQDVADEAQRFEGDLEYVGIGALTRPTDEGVLILRVAAGGPADLAGVRPFDTIIAIDGIPVLDEAQIGPAGPIARVRGPAGTTVVLQLRDTVGVVREVAVVRGVIAADAFPSVEATRLPGTNTGLLLIDTFSLEAVDERVREAIDKLTDGGPIDGLVIDVRSNTGGVVYLMENTVGLFVDGGTIGETVGRTRRELVTIPEGRKMAQLEDVPIVVLTSEGTVSAGEMFAAGMQVLGRARVVGTASAGNTENLLAHGFSDGSRLWLAELTYQLPDGTPIEGRGVIPDRIVDAEWWRFPAERDPQILAALDLLAEQRANS